MSSILGAIFSVVGGGSKKDDEEAILIAETRQQKLRSQDTFQERVEAQLRELKDLDEEHKSIQLRIESILPAKSIAFTVGSAPGSTIDAASSAKLRSSDSVIDEHERDAENEQLRTENNALRSEILKLKRENSTLENSMEHYKRLYEQQKKITSVTNARRQQQISISSSSSSTSSSTASFVNSPIAQPETLQSVYDEYENVVKAYLDLLEENNKRLEQRRSVVGEAKQKLRGLQLRMGTYQSMARNGQAIKEVERHWEKKKQIVSPPNAKATPPRAAIKRPESDADGSCAMFTFESGTPPSSTTPTTTAATTAKTETPLQTTTNVNNNNDFNTTLRPIEADSQSNKNE